MASTSIIADMQTVVANGPNAASLAKAINQAGPIIDYKGNSNLLVLKFQETTVLGKQLKADVDSTDATNLSLLNGVLACLNGTGSPSTQLITDMGTIETNGYNAASTAKAIAQAGPIEDIVGLTKLVRLKLKESLVLLKVVIQDTDSTDATNLSLLNGISAVLV